MRLVSRKGFIVALVESSFIASLLTIGASISTGFKLHFLFFLMIIALCAMLCLYALILNILRQKIIKREKERISVAYVVAANSGIWSFGLMVVEKGMIFSIFFAFLFYLFIYCATDEFNRNVFEKKEVL